MTREEIKKRIEHIESVSGDYEAAHSLEDSLRADFIQHIADLGGAFAENAKLVLTTDKIDFKRYTA